MTFEPVTYKASALGYFMAQCILQTQEGGLSWLSMPCMNINNNDFSEQFLLIKDTAYVPQFL